MIEELRLVLLTDKVMHPRVCEQAWFASWWNVVLPLEDRWDQVAKEVGAFHTCGGTDLWLVSRYAVCSPLQVATVASSVACPGKLPTVATEEETTYASDLTLQEANLSQGPTTGGLRFSDFSQIRCHFMQCSEVISPMCMW